MKLPNIWPVFNLINIITLDEQELESAAVIKSNNSSWILQLVILYQLRLSTYLIVAFLVYNLVFPSYDEIISQNSEHNSLSWWSKWFFIIFVRDQIIAFIFYGGWHYILFDSIYAPKMKKLKFNPDYPDSSQWEHDRFYTLIGIAFSSLFELFMIWFYKTYQLKYDILYRNWGFLSISFWLWLLISPYWREFHFYVRHRALHKWRWKIFGIDVGEWLYKNIHYVHHKSPNTGPWSSLSQHPIEQMLLYSNILFPSLLFIKQHPFHMLFAKCSSNLAPLAGHDGFDSPGGGSYMHYLHHAHYECNYGTPTLPFDKLFGTFEDGEKYRKNKKIQ